MRQKIMLFTTVLIVSSIFVACNSVVAVTSDSSVSEEIVFKYPISYTTELEQSRNKIEESRKYEIAEAVIATIESESDSSEELETAEVVEVASEEVVEIVAEEELVYDSDFEQPVETGNYYEDIPDETSEVWQYEEPVQPQMQYLGFYHVTHYSAEACGNNIGARERTGGMVEGDSIAMPEGWMLGCRVYVEGYGYFTVDDISPDGVADIFHNLAKDAVGDDYRDVYLIAEE